MITIAPLWARLAGAACALAMLAAAPAARAELIYSFVCADSPPCHGDANFRASFSFNAPSASALANKTFTAADPRYAGWSFATSFGNYSASGTGFVFRDLSDIEFTFNATGTEIYNLIDLVSTTISIGLSTSQFISFKEGEFSRYYLNMQVFESSFNQNTVDGDFVLQATPEPASLALLGVGLLGLVGAGGRRTG